MDWRLNIFSRSICSKEIKLLHVGAFISSANQTSELLKVNIFTIFAKAIVKYYVEVFLVFLVFNCYYHLNNFGLWV